MYRLHYPLYQTCRDTTEPQQYCSLLRLVDVAVEYRRPPPPSGVHCLGHLNRLDPDASILRSWLRDDTLLPSPLSNRFDDPHPPGDDELDLLMWQAARRAYHELAAAEYLQLLTHLAANGDVRTLAAVDNYWRSLHGLCLAGHIPCPPVGLGATSLHLEPWREISPHDVSFPPPEHRNPAVLRMYHQMALSGSVEGADDSSGES